MNASKMVIKKYKKSQIWVETAVYTLIGLAIISILLAVVNPQINKMKDKGIIIQTVEVMSIIDGKLTQVLESTGSIGIVPTKIGKGAILINSTNDSIQYLLTDSNLKFSELGQEIRDGNFYEKTEKHGSKFNIIITRYYNGINITYKGEEKPGTLQSGTLPYQLKIENKGKDNVNSLTVIDFSLI